MSLSEADMERDLDDYLAVEVPVQASEDGARGPVAAAKDEEFADRLLYKARRLTEELGKTRALAAARRADIDAWEEDRSSGIAREIARAEESLELFARQWQRSHPRSKTISLPNGELKLRAGRGKIIVEDEHAFVEWAKARGRDDLIRYEPKVKKADLAEADRHVALQVNDPGTGELVQTYRLMVDVPALTPEGRHQADDNGELLTESASVPGVVYAEPVQDRFTVTLPDPTTKENHHD